MIHMVSKDTRHDKMHKIFEKWPPSPRLWARMVVWANLFKLSGTTV